MSTDVYRYYIVVADINRCLQVVIRICGCMWRLADIYGYLVDMYRHSEIDLVGPVGALAGGLGKYLQPCVQSTTASVV